MLAATKYYITTYSLIPFIASLFILACDIVVLKKETVLSFLKDNLIKYIACFFILLIYNSTVFARIGKIHFEPFSDVLGGWKIIYYQYATNYACIFNVILFLPVFTCILHYAKKKNKTFSNKSILIYTSLFSFCLSLSVELLQVVLRVGTFQLSDLTYNTLGGFIGALLYYVINKAIKRKNSSE